MPGLANLIRKLKGDDWVGRFVDGYYDRAYPERYDEPNVEVHPSGAGSPCARDIQLGMLGHRPATKSRNRRRMDNGTDAHTRWTNDLREVGLLKHANVRLVLEGELAWSGEFDIALERPDSGTLHLGEIKTMNERRWRNVPKQDPDRYKMARLLLETERGYVYQLAHYYEQHRQTLPLDGECFFLFENTNTQEYKVRYVSFDDALIEAAFKNPVAAHDACKTGELIPMPFQRKSPVCRGCHREDLCYSISDGALEAVEWSETALAKTKRK